MDGLAETLVEKAPAPADTDWWRGAVIYEIYVRSFQDSTGSGTGDLAGITRRLDYLAWLGVDAIWISPFYPSPMADFGYDVADHCAVDPMFGTLDDFDRLVARAHELGLKVMIDLVLSHTSARHPWFVESRSSPSAAKADWYVWADARADGSPPNNWRSVFGGPAWEWDATRHQYYLHNFLDSQPDLNFHNPAVQDAVLDVARFWLDRGVDGFRLDTVNFYFCDRELTDNPPRALERRRDTATPAVNPYGYQEHIYDKNRPETVAFLRRLRAVVDRYPAKAVLGEIGEAENGLELIGAYTSGGDKLQMCYSFDFLTDEPLAPDRIRSFLERFAQVAPDGWACWAFSNHDVIRHATRWGGDDGDRAARLRLFAAMLLFLRGSACIYQGEELGLAEAEIAFEDLQDPYGIRFWPTFRGRDGCRTPMVWDEGEPNAGFTAVRPWLMIPREHLGSSVAAQTRNPESLLSHYRRLLALRRKHAALVAGDIRFVASEGPVLAFIRAHPTGAIYCAFNMSDAEAALGAPAGVSEPLGESGFAGRLEARTIVLPAYQAFVAKMR